MAGDNRTEWCQQRKQNNTREELKFSSMMSKALQIDATTIFMIRLDVSFHGT